MHQMRVRWCYLWLKKSCFHMRETRQSRFHAIKQRLFGVSAAHKCHDFSRSFSWVFFQAHAAARFRAFGFVGVAGNRTSPETSFWANSVSAAGEKRNFKPWRTGLRMSAVSRCQQRFLTANTEMPRVCDAVLMSTSRGVIGCGAFGNAAADEVLLMFRHQSFFRIESCEQQGNYVPRFLPPDREAASSQSTVADRFADRSVAGVYDASGC